MYENKISKEKCLENNVGYYEYLGSFVYCMLFMYVRYKNNISSLKELKGKTDYKSQYLFRNIAQNDYINGYDYCFEKQSMLFDKARNKIFNWLDKTKEPYFFILNPVYNYNTYMCSGGYGLYKENLTGFNKDTFDLLKDYSLYKINSYGL